MYVYWCVVGCTYVCECYSEEIVKATPVLSCKYVDR